MSSAALNPKQKWIAEEDRNNIAETKKMMLEVRRRMREVLSASPQIHYIPRDAVDERPVVNGVSMPFEFGWRVYTKLDLPQHDKVVLLKSSVWHKTRFEAKCALFEKISGFLDGYESQVGLAASVPQLRILEERGRDGVPEVYDGRPDQKVALVKSSLVRYDTEYETDLEEDFEDSYDDQVEGEENVYIGFIDEEIDREEMLESQWRFS